MRHFYQFILPVYNFFKGHFVNKSKVLYLNCIKEC
jgi:hypothetical protein